MVVFKIKKGVCKTVTYDLVLIRNYGLYLYAEPESENLL